MRTALVVVASLVVSALVAGAVVIGVAIGLLEILRKAQE
jgi:hypothetical protein